MAQVYRWSDTVFAWTGLRAIGNSRVARAAIFIPVFGYFILFNDVLVRYLKLHSDFCSANDCEVGWRIFMIYFGSCAAAFGSIVFAYRCLHIVKRYATSREFFETSRLFYAHPHNLGWMLDDIQQMQGAAYDDGLNLSQIVSNKAVLNLNDAHVLAGPMAAYYNLRNQSNKLARVITFAFYIIAATSFAIPTVVAFYQVTSLAIVKARPVLCEYLGCKDQPAPNR